MNLNLLSAPVELNVGDSPQSLSFYYNDTLLTTHRVQPFDSKVTLDLAFLYAYCPLFASSTPVPYVAYSVRSTSAISHSYSLDSATVTWEEPWHLLSIPASTFPASEIPQSVKVWYRSQSILMATFFIPTPERTDSTITFRGKFMGQFTSFDHVDITTSTPSSSSLLEGPFYNSYSFYTPHTSYSHFAPLLPFTITAHQDTQITVDGTTYTVNEATSRIFFPTQSVLVNGVVPPSAPPCSIALSGVNSIGHLDTYFTPHFSSSYSRSETLSQFNSTTSEVALVSPSQSFTLTFFSNDVSPDLISSLRHPRLYSSEFPTGVPVSLSLSPSDSDFSYQVVAKVLINSNF